jgi:hypothetical protein
VRIHGYIYTSAPIYSGKYSSGDGAAIRAVQDKRLEVDSSVAAMRRESDSPCAASPVHDNRLESRQGYVHTHCAPVPCMMDSLYISLDFGIAEKGIIFRALELEMTVLSRRKHATVRSCRALIKYSLCQELSCILGLVKIKLYKL